MKYRDSISGLVNRHNGNLIIFNVKSWLNDELQGITYWMIVIEFAAY